MKTINTGEGLASNNDDSKENKTDSASSRPKIILNTIKTTQVHLFFIISSLHLTYYPINIMPGLLYNIPTFSSYCSR
jgi:hypothetical protein